MSRGNRKTALERPGLRVLGITHVLNAAEGKWNNVLTGAHYYTDMDIQYFGVEADDKPTFNISQFFCSATQFIHKALSHPQSKCWTKSKAFDWDHSLKKKPVKRLSVSDEASISASSLLQARCWCTV